MIQQHSESMEQVRTTVLDFIDALNKEDFDTARQYVNEDFSFVGVLGSRDGAEAYFNDMKKMKLKYKVKKAFVDEDDVCLFYDIDMGSTTVFASGWYSLVNDKISSLRVVFDPRPVLEQKK